MKIKFTFLAGFLMSIILVFVSQSDAKEPFFGVMYDYLWNTKFNTTSGAQFEENDVIMALDNLGVGSIRIPIRHPEIILNRFPLIFKFERYDQIISLIPPDIEIVGQFDYYPYETIGGILTSDYKDTFAQYVSAVIDRYKGRIRSWEILNEHNSKFGGIEPNPALYAELLKIAKDVIDLKDPAGVCVIGGFTHNGVGYHPQGWFSYFDPNTLTWLNNWMHAPGEYYSDGTPVFLADSPVDKVAGIPAVDINKTYLARLYDDSISNGVTSFDILAIHPYTNRHQKYEYPNNFSGSEIEQTDESRSLLFSKSSKEFHRKVWWTEFGGVNTSSNVMSDILFDAHNQTQKVDRIMWYYLRDISVMKELKVQPSGLISSFLGETYDQNAALSESLSWTYYDDWGNNGGQWSIVSTNNYYGELELIPPPGGWSKVGKSLDSILPISSDPEEKTEVNFRYNILNTVDPGVELIVSIGSDLVTDHLPQTLLGGFTILANKVQGTNLHDVRLYVKSAGSSGIGTLLYSAQIEKPTRLSLRFDSSGLYELYALGTFNNKTEVTLINNGSISNFNQIFPTDHYAIALGVRNWGNGRGKIKFDDVSVGPLAKDILDERFYVYRDVMNQNEAYHQVFDDFDAPSQYYDFDDYWLYSDDWNNSGGNWTFIDFDNDGDDELEITPPNGAWSRAGISSIQYGLFRNFEEMVSVRVNVNSTTTGVKSLISVSSESLLDNLEATNQRGIQLNILTNESTDTTSAVLYNKESGTTGAGTIIYSGQFSNLNSNAMEFRFNLLGEWELWGNGAKHENGSLISSGVFSKHVSDFINSGRFFARFSARNEGNGRGSVVFDDIVITGTSFDSINAYPNKSDYLEHSFFENFNIPYWDLTGSSKRQKFNDSKLLVWDDWRKSLRIAGDAIQQNGYLKITPPAGGSYVTRIGASVNRSIYKKASIDKLLDTSVQLDVGALCVFSLGNQPYEDDTSWSGYKTVTGMSYWLEIHRTNLSNYNWKIWWGNPDSKNIYGQLLNSGSFNLPGDNTWIPLRIVVSDENVRFYKFYNSQLGNTYSTSTYKTGISDEISSRITSKYSNNSDFGSVKIDKFIIYDE